MAWYFKNGEQISGPHQPQELKQAANQGIITAATQVRQDDGEWISASRVPGLLTPNERYYYYDDATAQRRGPYNKSELENFYRSGAITDSTTIENQAGRTTEWKNLIRKAVAPSPKPDDDDNFTPMPTPIPIPPSRDDDDASDDFAPIPPKRNDDDGNNAPFSFVGWLCDFRFKQSYIMKILRLLAVIFYITEVAYILFVGVGLCLATFAAAVAGLNNNEASASLLLLLLPLILVGIVLAIILARLSCEFYLFFMDWLVTTKKAADKYNAE